MDYHIRRDLTLRATAQAERVRIKNKIERTAAIDPIIIAEGQKCEVWLASLTSLEGVYSSNPGPAIILGSQRPAGRRAFTCAHELGHHEFKHGACIDELDVERFAKRKNPEEFLADMFAASLLMSKGSVRRAIKERKIRSELIKPIDVFQLSSYFGVGYSTLVEHMTWTLQIINSQQRKKLLRTQPKELKTLFGGAPQSEVILVDEFWRGRSVDLEIGDILIMQRDAIVEASSQLISQGTNNGQQTFQAVSRGITRAFSDNIDWAVNIRVAPKHFEGLARYRFLDDPEEECKRL